MTSYDPKNVKTGFLGGHMMLLKKSPMTDWFWGKYKEATPAQAAAVRRELGVGAGTPIVVYTGTFEAYQGLDLLFEAMAVVRSARPDARLVLVGGRSGQVAPAREQASAAHVADVVLLLYREDYYDLEKAQRELVKTQAKIEADHQEAERRKQEVATRGH